MSSPGIDISIIVPVYRGKEILKLLTDKIISVLKGRYIYEILFVCDGCDNISAEIAGNLQRDYPGSIKTYRLYKNYGQQRALLFGLSKASGDLIVTMDEDLQHDPEYINALIAKQKEGNYDVVYGRFLHLRQSLIRQKMSFIARAILKHSIPEIYPWYSPFRILKMEISDKILKTHSPVSIDYQLGSSTKRINYIDIKHNERFNGQSSYSLIKLAMYFLITLSFYSDMINILFLGGGFLIFLFFLLNSSKAILVSGMVLILSGLAGLITNFAIKKCNSKPVQVFQ